MGRPVADDMGPVAVAAVLRTAKLPRSLAL